MSKKVLNLEQTMNYSVRQFNGQRKFGPPLDWKGPPPPKGCEVFIGRLPSEVFEDELIPLFSTVGRIYELRTMLTLSGTNRGYAFLNYSSQIEASAAITKLHNYEIRLGRRIAVVKSVDNCRLYLGGIPKQMTKDEIMIEMSKVVKGIVNVILYKNCFNRCYNRGFAFIEFANHYDAQSAWQLLRSSPVCLWKHNIIVDWAEPEPHIRDEVMNNVKILYIRNLFVHTETNTIRKVFETAINNKVERVKKMYDYAFIHFYKREHAETAMTKLQNNSIDEMNIEIKWARPVDRKIYKVQKMFKGNAKFNSNNGLEKALVLYENTKRTHEVKSPDEGIASIVPSDYNSISSNEIEKTDIFVKTDIYQDSISQCPLLKLDDVSKRFRWPPPTYYFQRYMNTDGGEVFCCSVEFGNIVVGSRRFNITSIPCLTLYDAQICAADYSLYYIRMLELRGCASSLISQNIISLPVSSFYVTYKNPINRTV